MNLRKKKEESRQLSPMRKQKCQFAVSCLSISLRQQPAKKGKMFDEWCADGKLNFSLLFSFQGDDVNWGIRVENSGRDGILKMMNTHNYTL